MDALDDFLLSLDVPALRSLHLRVDEDFTSDVLLQMVSASKCALKDLHVSGSRYLFPYLAAFDALVALLPSLKRLHLGAGDCDPESFDPGAESNITALSFIPSENRLPLPLLEKLTIVTSTDGHTQLAAAVQDMLRSRLEPGGGRRACLQFSLIIVVEEDARIWACKHGSRAIKMVECRRDQLVTALEKLGPATA